GRERRLFLGLGKIHGRPMFHPCLGLVHASACCTGPYDAYRSRRRPVCARTLRRANRRLRYVSAYFTGKSSGDRGLYGPKNTASRCSKEAAAPPASGATELKCAVLDGSCLTQSHAGEPVSCDP